MTGSPAEGLATLFNVLGLLAHMYLLSMNFTQRRQASSKTRIYSKALLLIAANRNLRCILNRTFVNISTLMLSLWLLFLPERTTWFYYIFSYTIMLIPLVSLLCSVYDIKGELTTSELLQE